MPLNSSLGTPDSILGTTQVLGNPNAAPTATPPACPVAGWGTGPWGTFPWGGASPIVAGGAMPTQAPFNVYCVGPCGEISVLYTFPAVEIDPAGDFTIDAPTGDAVITSVDDTEAHLFVNLAPASDWSLEFTLKGTYLPANFSDVDNHHLYVGVVDQAATAAGLFFSSGGVAYAATIDSAVQLLPGSDAFFSEGEYYIVLLAASTSTGALYVYITSLIEFPVSGHQLRYILPTIPYSATPMTQASGTHIYAIGDAADPTQVYLDELCLGNGVLVPNLPPVADAGPDQAIKFCEIVKLDGTASFDPEGAPLTYFWRLIDAPTGSMFAFSGTDGDTIPQSAPTGFTNKLYSSGFSGPNAIPVDAGDVLLVGGIAYGCVLVSSDVNGPYVQISGNDLPDDLTNVTYTILKQNGISGANTATPTFYPDVTGFFKFDLVVSDGSSQSDPRAVVVVNVVESALPRGIIPDLSFMWNYLSDFWKLLEDPDRIGTLWSSLAQVAATELYTLWQVDYSKSLKDIQRTAVRRWLHYDLLLREPFIEITANRFIFRGIDSVSIPNAGVSAVGGTLSIVCAFLGVPTITYSGTNPLTPTQIATQIAAALQMVDLRFVVTVVPVDGSNSLIRIYAPFSFSVGASTGVSWALPSNANLGGAAGVLLGPLSYQTEISLLGLDIQPNDNLAVFVRPPLQAPFWQSVRISAVVDNPADTLRFQRILLQDPLPLYATANWNIPSKALSTQLDFWDGLVNTGDIALYEVTDAMEGTTTFYQSVVIAATPTQTNTLLLDASGISDFLQLPTRFQVFFWGVYRRGYMPIEPLIVDIPYLQRVIKDPSENEVLRRNLDFFLDTYRGSPCIRFDPSVWVVTEGFTIPVPRLWAEYNYLDNRPTIEANFGIPVDFTLEDLAQLPSTVDYLGAVQGLWYAYLHGPTIFDLRVGTQILLGLPFAEVEGTITEIRTDFSPNNGRILIQDDSDATIVRSYEYPQALALEVNPATGVTYVVGDDVQQFAPLVTGVTVEDWVKNASWFQKYLQQGVFFEIDKFFTFFVSVSSAVFNLPALLFVKSFLLKIKPTYTYPLFVVTATVDDADITVTDEVDFKVFLDLYAGAIYGLKQTTIADSPDPGPGEVISQVPTNWTGLLSSGYVNVADTNTDADYPGNTFPTYPTSDPVIVSGADKPFLSPAQFATAFASTAFGGGTPTVDGTIFRTDFPAYEGAQYALGCKYLTDVLVAGIPVGSSVVASGTQTLNCCEIFIEGIFDPNQNTNYTLEISKNGVLQDSLAFSYTATDRHTFLFASFLSTFTSISVVNTDVLSIKLLAAGPNNTRVLWNNFFVTLGSGVALGSLSAGTYTRLAPA